MIQFTSKLVKRFTILIYFKKLTKTNLFLLINYSNIRSLFKFNIKKKTRF